MALLRNMVTAVSQALERQRAILDGHGHRQAVSLPHAVSGWRSMQQSGKGQNRTAVNALARVAQEPAKFLLFSI
jgi:hypothetical protein